MRVHIQQSNGDAPEKDYLDREKVLGTLMRTLQDMGAVGIHWETTASWRGFESYYCIVSVPEGKETEAREAVLATGLPEWYVEEV